MIAKNGKIHKMNVQIPIQRLTGRDTQVVSQGGIMGRILDAAVCISEDGDTSCKEKLGVRKFNGVYRTEFQVDGSRVPSFVVQKDTGEVLYTSFLLSRTKSNIFTIPKKWWLLCSPHTWFEKVNVKICNEQ